MISRTRNSWVADSAKRLTDVSATSRLPRRLVAWWVVRVSKMSWDAVESPSGCAGGPCSCQKLQWKAERKQWSMEADRASWLAFIMALWQCKGINILGNRVHRIIFTTISSSALCEVYTQGCWVINILYVLMAGVCKVTFDTSKSQAGTRHRLNFGCEACSASCWDLGFIHSLGEKVLLT